MRLVRWLRGVFGRSARPAPVPGAPATPLAGTATFAIVTADPKPWCPGHHGRVACVADAAAARSDWVVFHAPGTTPRPDALHVLADAIARHATAAFVFGDAVGSDGKPWHKPGWSPALLLAQPYAADLFAVRRDRLTGIAPSGVADAVAIYELALRATANGNVVHVPSLMVTAPAATRLSPGHAVVSADFLARLGLDATVTPHPAAPVLRLSMRPRTRTPITVIVPTRDRIDLLRTCIDSVLRHRGEHDLRVLIVDNNSVEPATLAAFAQWQQDGRVDVLRDERPFDYAALMNVAVAAARTPLVLLLNNDTEVLSPDWLDQLAGWLDLPDVAAGGAKLYHGDGTIQHAGVLVGVGGVASHGHKNFPRDHAGYHGLLHSVRDVSAATAACLLVRRDAWLQVGGMKSELKVAYNDVDFCLELRARGHRILWTPLAELHHFEGKSRGKDNRGQARFEQEIAFFQSRWADVIAADPFYNRNLSLRHVDYRPR